MATVARASQPLPTVRLLSGPGNSPPVAHALHRLSNRPTSEVCLERAPVHAGALFGLTKDVWDGTK